MERWARLRWLGLLLCLGSTVRGEQVTLVADAHVNAALPAVNSGAISNINVGGGYTGLVQFRPGPAAQWNDREPGGASRSAALHKPGGYRRAH